MLRSVSLRFVFALAALLALAACQSSEERAEGHYQSALERMADGDVDRALVELRNVFDLDGTHLEARRLYADTVRDRGQLSEAYGQYLRLVEQYPDDLQGRLALAEMALDRRDWDEVRRHGAEAQRLAPDAPDVQLIALNIAYADALEAEDAPARREIQRQAEALLADRPDDLQLRRILVDGALRDGAYEEALAQIDGALQIAPEDRTLYDTRLRLLAQLERTDEMEGALRQMIDLFPEDAGIVANLVRLYVSRGDIDAAETFLRARAEAAPADVAVAYRSDLIQFLVRLRDTDTALAELDRTIAASDAPEMFQSIRARIRFDTGERVEAISEMEALLDGAGTDATANENRVILARMLEATGDRVGAQQLVAEVLEVDPSQVEALKMQADWLIVSDEADEAISLLRIALDQAPRDVGALTLMAEAHTRNGNRDLARDMMSLAVEASNSAPAESLRYVEMLLADDRARLAEDVLIDALRLSTGNVDLLLELGQLYIREEDWSRSRQVEAQLRRIDTPETRRAADGLQATRLQAEGRADEAISFLEGLAAENDDDVAARIAVIRTRLMNGDTDGALETARAAVAAAPDDIALLVTLAATLSAVGDLAESAATYRQVLERDDQIESAWIGLLRALAAQGDTEAAEAVLAEGLNVLPDAMNLLWAEASFLEQAGDLEGALQIYAALYERAPNQPVIVNNYASLLSVLRDDPESLERAFQIARRLRGSESPAFRDTYGWIAHLRGDDEAALDHLEAAAVGLADDPVVQYHLAEVYAALGRTDEARAQYQRVLDLAAPDDDRPEIQRARAVLDAPGALPEDPPATE